MGYHLEIYNFRTRQYNVYWPLTIRNQPRPSWPTVQETLNFALNQLGACGRATSIETGEVQIIEGIEPQRLWSVVNGVYHRGYND